MVKSDCEVAGQDPQTQAAGLCFVLLARGSPVALGDVSRASAGKAARPLSSADAQSDSEHDQGPVPGDPVSFGDCLHLVH